MKTNMAQISSKRKKKNSTLFAIELDIKNLVFLIFLASLTGITIFYLGMLFGKATRDPNLGLVEKNPENISDPNVKTKAVIPKDLKIFDIRDQDNSLDNLKKDFNALSKKSDRLIDKTKEDVKAQDRLITEAKKISSVTTQNEKTAEPKRWPENKKKASLGTGNIYTLQVLATISKEKSDLITKQLLQKGFDAYVISDRVDNRTLYKVRVGRKGKDSIRTLKPRLDRVVAGMGVKTKILKIK